MTASFQICAKDTMPKMNTHSPFDLDTMALTVWAEARGELRMGQRAVAWVIRNRYENPGWWSRNRDGIQDDTIAAVCRDPWQFSCWNKSDPQSKILHDHDTLKRNDVKAIRALCESVLERGPADDVSKGADHYCTVKVIPKTKWAKGKTPVIVIKNHAFFKIGLDGKG